MIFMLPFCRDGNKPHRNGLSAVTANTSTDGEGLRCFLDDADANDYVNGNFLILGSHLNLGSHKGAGTRGNPACPMVR